MRVLEALGHPLHRDRPAPRRDAGEARLLLAEQDRADRRAQAVGADHDVAEDLVAVLEPRHDAVRPLLEPDELGVEPHALGGDLLDEALEEVGAVHADVHVAVVLGHARVVLGEDRAPVVHAPPLAGVDAHAAAADVVRRAQLRQHAHRVRVHADAGADLRQLGRLLQDVRVQARLLQGDGGGHPTDAAADHEDPHSTPTCSLQVTRTPFERMASSIPSCATCSSMRTILRSPTAVEEGLVTLKRLRVDNVGSMLRPAALREAFVKFADGGLSEEQLTHEQDEAIRAVIAHQERIGFPIVVDGEFRRTGLPGELRGHRGRRGLAQPLDAPPPAPRAARHRRPGPRRRPRPQRRPAHAGPRQAAPQAQPAAGGVHLRRQKQTATPAKITIIGPDRVSTLHHLGHPDDVYGDADEFMADVVEGRARDDRPDRRRRVQVHPHRRAGLHRLRRRGVAGGPAQPRRRPVRSTASARSTRTTS